MQTILGTINYYKSELGPSQSAAYNQFESALRHFLMPGWGFPRPPKRSTQADLDNANYALGQLPIEKLYDWEIALEKGFDLAGKDDRQRSVPRSHIRKHYKWCIDKGILVDPTCHEMTPKVSPPSFVGRGNRPNTRRNKVDMTPYSLKDDQISEPLQQEIDGFRKFSIEPFYKKRIKKSIRETTAEDHFRTHREMLGWLHNHCNVPLDELSFSSIIRPTSLTDRADAEAAAEEFRGFMYEFAKFLQRRGCYSGSIARKLGIITQLVQFQYLGQYHHPHGNDIPVMKVVRELLIYYEDCADNELDPLLIELKWLDLKEVIQKVTLPAFKFTESKTKDKANRPITAIANSFQDALLWSKSSLMAPRRPGEWRGCKMAMSCDLSGKPKDLLAGEWIWPLPTNRLDEEEVKYGYLTRQYVYLDPETQEKFGAYLGSKPPSDRYLKRVPLWFKDTPPQAAKSGDSHGHQQVLIMDRRVYRDKHIYDFLEAYIMGYWRDKYGNWISLGKSLEAPNSSFHFYELRSSIAANTTVYEDNGLIIQPSVWLYVGARKGNQHRCGDFGGKIARIAYKLTGQFLTPHLMRSVYAVHLLETVKDRATLISLAEAMGHKIETLERIYDKRRPYQKTRLSEIEISQQLDRICAGLPVSVNTPFKDSGVNVDLLKAAINQLSPREQNALKQFLV
ncbi:MAG: hypothetical protein KME47_00025 [Nodosilinea sp. WJT8-NPBG4]|jgi:hypothetical protein|nr:hypothetical protein [Nodosilinea sp. WJT8-NPBG4]